MTMTLSRVIVTFLLSILFSVSDLYAQTVRELMQQALAETGQLGGTNEPNAFSALILKQLNSGDIIPTQLGYIRDSDIVSQSAIGIFNPNSRSFLDVLEYETYNNTANWRYGAASDAWYDHRFKPDKYGNIPLVFTQLSLGPDIQYNYMIGPAGIAKPESTGVNLFFRADAQGLAFSKEIINPLLLPRSDAELDVWPPHEQIQNIIKMRASRSSFNNRRGMLNYGVMFGRSSGSIARNTGRGFLSGLALPEGSETTTGVGTAAIGAARYAWLLGSGKFAAATGGMSLGGTVGAVGIGGGVVIGGAGATYATLRHRNQLDQAALEAEWTIGTGGTLLSNINRHVIERIRPDNIEAIKLMHKDRHIYQGSYEWREAMRTR